MCANAAAHLVFFFKQNLSLTQAGLAGLLFVLFYADSEDVNSGPRAYY